ncbi:hypothetical protein [Streptomyces sp. NBC_01373]|uniref:hypothetical protein n=1 Tax=Streptomyces sp. NBC_01373 TaxID=2903843 RepID=UPI0022544C44|nr:hypothetical protein [Streptomyces sp. NBC_01373]MCX4704433.1 hypothetical protein [Streptomyces sp. NBC_01373]
MEYVALDAQVGDLSGVLDPTRYLELLPSIADDLPPGAQAFATDADHYDFRSKRCVKDLELQLVRGVDTGDDEVEIQLRHNCWKHDADLVIHYTGVSDVSVRTPEAEVEADDWTNLGAVILDEILPHKNGCSHELACRNGTLTVICHDLLATWTGVDCSTGS